MTRQSASSERGAAAVEAALAAVVAIPLLFFSVLFFGLWGFSSSQVSSAAKDGARKAILDPSNTAMVVNAVESRLGTSLGTPSVTILCSKYTPTTDSWSTPTNATCAESPNAGFIPGRARVTVEVEWNLDALSGVSGLFTSAVPSVSADSTRDYVGVPQ